MRKFFEIGGIVAAVILIAFGITSIVVGVNGRDTVQKSLKQEAIVGSPDMTPTGIRAEAKKAGLPATIDYPTMATRRDAVVKRMYTGLKTLVTKNNVTWVEGRGRLDGPGKIRVSQRGEDGTPGGGGDRVLIGLGPGDERLDRRVQARAERQEKKRRANGATKD
jgi:hypothetical protein